MTIKWYGLIVFPITLEKGGTKFPTMKNVVVCSDAGSGYKKTQLILGMINVFDKSGVSVFRWGFNSSGEGEISTTDGHNISVKARREMSMKGECVPT